MERFYCGVDKDLENFTLKDVKKVKVCDGRDELSSVKYSELIEKHKHLPFYEVLKVYKPQDRGSIIRWLYRGLTLKQALIKHDHKIKQALRWGRVPDYSARYTMEKIRNHQMKCGIDTQRKD